MISSKQDLRDYISHDLERNLRGKKISRFEYELKHILGHENIIACEYLKCLRRLEYSINCRHGLLGKFFRLYYEIKLRRKSIKYGILIAPNCCGYGLRLTHFSQGGIIINCQLMGNNCSANSGVVIGNKNSQENRPVIGDNVQFTLGCKVIGKITIGNDSIIAPNSVVIKDVPSKAVMSGVPAKIIKIQD